MVLRRLPTFIVMALITMMTNLTLAANETPCLADSDCPMGQYCYTVSGICVDYTQCSRYNRHEGDKNAQSPAQCGSCLAGYVAELLATGIPASLCKKTLHQPTNQPTPSEKKLWIYVAAGIIITSIILGLFGLLLKKHVTQHGSEKWFRKMRGWSCTPTAPPPDNGIYQLQSSFYNDEEPPIYSAVMNNNGNIKDKNRLVSATPCHPPDWVHVDQNYGQDNTDAVTSTNVSTTLQIEDDDTTPSNWTPEEVTVSLPARPFQQFGTEQRDNVLNAVLVRGDCASTSESTEETTPGPAPGATGNTRNAGENYRGPNVQINQMITLNLVNNDH